MCNIHNPLAIVLITLMAFMLGCMILLIIFPKKSVIRFTEEDSNETFSVCVEGGDPFELGKAADAVRSYRINRSKSVAVDPLNRFQSMDTCPTGVKVQLLGPGHVATYGTWDGKDNQWLGWYPVPAAPIKE